MKLYGHPGSICTNRALLTFAEKAPLAQLEFVHVDLATGAQQSKEHLARHPFGVIPVLEDGGFSLYESRAIMRYLDDALGGEKLAPSAAKARARMEQWISVEASYLSAPVSVITMQKFVVPMRGGTPDAALVERARGDIERVFGVLDGALAQAPFLAGDRFSLAEVSIAPLVLMLGLAGEGELVSGRKHLAAWWARVSSRPSFGELAAFSAR